MIITLPAGAPDALDVWLDSETPGDLDEAWGEWRELTFDPDCDPWIGE